MRAGWAHLSVVANDATRDLRVKPSKPRREPVEAMLLVLELGVLLFDILTCHIIGWRPCVSRPNRGRAVHTPEMNVPVAEHLETYASTTVTRSLAQLGLYFYTPPWPIVIEVRATEVSLSHRAEARST